MSTLNPGLTLLALTRRTGVRAGPDHTISLLEWIVIYASVAAQCPSTSKGPFKFAVFMAVCHQVYSPEMVE